MVATQQLNNRTVNDLRLILDMDIRDGQLHVSKISLKLLFFSSTTFGLAYFNQVILVACSVRYVETISFVPDSGPWTNQKKISANA